MEEIISKEEVKKLMRIKGEVRGLSFRAEGEYVLKEKGIEGLKRLENELEKIGCPINYNKIKGMEFYPIGLKAVTVTTIKKLFNFDEERLREIGSFGVKMPLVIRLFMRYLGSVDIAAKAAPTMWRKYYSVGDLKVIELNKEDKRIVLRLENFKLVSYFCHYVCGYFATMIGMIVGAKTFCEESKCVHKGDQYHEFLIKW